MQICYDGAAGMAYIHSLGHVHRDVKSPNLLISQNNSCKVRGARCPVPTP